MGNGKVLRLLVIAVVVLLSNMSLGINAAQYNVGGDSVAGEFNWRCCDIDYTAWASTIQSFVGDTFYFTYDTNITTLAIVDEKSYNSCLNITRGNIYMFSPAIATIISPGMKYFMTTGFYCNQLRFSIHAMENPINSTPPVSSHSSSPPSSPPSESPLPTYYGFRIITDTRVHSSKHKIISGIVGPIGLLICIGVIFKQI